ncbi:MAG: sulfotransferase [Bacteroidota bacterium]
MPAQLSKRYVRTRPTKALSRLVSWALVEGRPLTTRGQWINPVVFGLQRAALTLPLQRPVDRPIFVIGTGRSGTTVLGTVLSMHRDVAFLNEPKAVWHRIHPEEDVIGSYANGPARFRLDASEATPARAAVARRLFGAYLAAVRGQRLVDKYPELVFRIPFVRALFPDARLVFLVRNGWDACASIQNWSERLGVEQKSEVHDWWGRDDRKWHLLLDYAAAHEPDLRPIVPSLRHEADHRQRAAVEWVLAMRAGREAERAHPECIHRVRYEDFTASPDATLRTLLENVGLRDDPVCRSFAVATLRDGQAHDAFTLRAEIAPFFHHTMERLGYMGAK